MFFIILLSIFSSLHVENVAIAHHKILNIELKIKNKKLHTSDMEDWDDRSFRLDSSNPSNRVFIGHLTCFCVPPTTLREQKASIMHEQSSLE